MRADQIDPFVREAGKAMEKILDAHVDDEMTGVKLEAIHGTDNSLRARLKLIMIRYESAVNDRINELKKQYDAIQP